MDRQLIGQVVRREINRQHGSVSAFVEQATGVSRRTVERVMRGDDTIQFAYLERIEGALGMPRDTLAMIGDHDVEGMREANVEADLARWVASHISRLDDSGNTAAS